MLLLELACRIQPTILPETVKYGDLDIEVAMMAAGKVGGDFYDILYGKDVSLWIPIGDVSGHGVTSGLIMMMTQTIHFTTTTHFSFASPDVDRLVNEVLFRYVHGVAHLLMVIYRQGSRTCELISTSGTFLNLIEDISESTMDASLMLDVGDILVLYTDGLTEARNLRGELFDIHRFMNLVKTHAGKEIHAMRDAVMEDVLAWCDGVIEDDMSLVVVRRVK